MDQFLGKVGAEGQIERYPAVDLSGLPYEHPPTMRGVGHGYFVVLPVTPNEVFDARLEQARQYVESLASPIGDSAPRKGKRAPAETAPVEATEGE